MTDRNISGLPPQQAKPLEERIYQQFNGVHSSQSSRSASPMMKPNQFPTPDLPMNRSIPQSQLPPSRPLFSTSSGPGSLQDISRLSNVGMNTVNKQNSSNLVPNSELGQTIPKRSLQPDKISMQNSVPNLNLNSSSQQIISNSSSCMMKESSNNVNSNPLPSHTSSNKPDGQNSQINLVPSSKSNYYGENRFDSNVQFNTNDKNQSNEVRQPRSLQNNAPQSKIQPQNFQRIPLQPSVEDQLSSNQRQGMFGQVNANPSNLAGSTPQQPPVLNTTMSTVQNNFGNLNINNKPSTYQQNIVPGARMPIPPANTQVYSQNALRFQNQQNAPLPVFQGNIRPTQVNYNGPPTVQPPVAPITSQQHFVQPPMDKSSLGQQSVSQPPLGQPSFSQPPLGQSNFRQPPLSQPNFNQPPLGQPPIGQQPLSQNTTQKSHVLSNRYPAPPPTNAFQPNMGLTSQNLPMQQQYSQQFPPKPNNYQPSSQPQYPGANIVQGGFNKLWGTESTDLLQTPNILPSVPVAAPEIALGNDILDQANCSTDIFRCTMTKIPENNSLLQKSRLPLGVLIHPFKDLNHLPVIQCNVIVRCRACRTYINPFVLFVDNKRWKCNLCYRINELPEEFQYDPVTKTYGDPSRRPEIKSATLEYIAPTEYMLRPPQPAVYLFLLDVSRLAVESGYLHIVSEMLLSELKNLPGDARTQIGFVGYDSAIHFYALPEGITQPHEMTVLDVDEVFLPTPDNLLINLKDRMDLITDLLTQLPTRYSNTYDTNSALGAALQAAYKMISATGGRVTVFQASLPNIGPGALTAREDPSQRTSTEVAHLNPATDFYKRLALECSGQQIAVDLFLVNSQYIDIATISGISRFSGGCVHHFPLLKPTKKSLCQSFARCFKRYLTRKIGFEAVMRIRCTRGLSIHTFHGNFFVRSTDLLSLPNINPDAGFGMQVAIEESLADVQTVCFQAALLYTSSKGERRIRVHTMCLPVASTLHDIIHSADQQCIIGLLSKMAVDRSMQSSLSDAREAFINVAIDILTSYKMSLNLGSPATGLLAPSNLKLLPLYISALLKHRAFRVGNSTRLDDRVMAMIEMKTKPLYMLMQDIYPDLYPIHQLENEQVIINSEEESVPVPPRLQLTARCLDSKSAFLMDMGEHMIVLVCSNVSIEFLNEVFGVPNYNVMAEEMYEIPMLDNIKNQRLHQFIDYLNENKPFAATVQVIKDNSSNRGLFYERLIEDRVENALSYHEFLQHLKTQVK